MSIIAANVRRLMAHQGLTYDQVVDATGLDARTIRGLVRGTNTPHARTLHRLATGLGVSVDELFDTAASADERDFDRATNPAVNLVLEAHPDVFENWSDDQFHELSSRVGVGGPLSDEAALAEARAMNAKRGILQKVAVILETDEAALFMDLVDAVYNRVTLRPSAPSLVPTHQCDLLH
jgi:transcriptional regulator with XRE-family HTH domain